MKEFSFKITGKVDCYDNEQEVIDMIYECIFGELYGESKDFKIEIEKIN